MAHMDFGGLIRRHSDAAKLQRLRHDGRALRRTDGEQGTDNPGFLTRGVAKPRVSPAAKVTRREPGL